MMEKIDPINGQCLCRTRIGDQILFMHSMNEAIDELGKFVYYRKKIISNYKRSFPKMEVGTQGYIRLDKKYN